MPYPVLRALDVPRDLDRYLDLRERRDEIDTELETLARVILTALEAEDDGQTEARGYVLSAKVRRTYAYSETVAEGERYVRDCKAAERASGVATLATATGYVEVKRSPMAHADRLLALAAEAVTAIAATE